MGQSFFCSIAGGILTVLAMNRVELIAPKFLRMIGMLALACSVVVCVWSGIYREATADSAWLVAMVFSAVCAVGSALIVGLAESVADRIAAVRAISLIGGLAGVVAASVWAWMQVDATQVTGPVAAMTVIGDVLGTFLIGSVTVAWLLGHAYLTATKMTIAPLRRFSDLFSLAVILRAVFVVVCVLLIKFGGPLGVPEQVGQRLGGSWLILSMRVAVGLVAVGVFAYMVRDCVKLRSTQSATGILYFASVFVYIGELSSRHLISAYGLPL